MSKFLIGDIEDLVPSFYATIRNGNLAFQQSGELALTVDTGFTGGISLPPNILRKLEIELIGREIFRLATGEDCVVAGIFRQGGNNGAQDRNLFYPQRPAGGDGFSFISWVRIADSFQTKQIAA